MQLIVHSYRHRFWICHRFTSKLFYFQPQGTSHLLTKNPRIIGTPRCDSCFFRVVFYYFFNKKKGTTLKCSPFLSCSTFLRFLPLNCQAGYVWARQLPINDAESFNFMTRLREQTSTRSLTCSLHGNRMFFVQQRWTRAPVLLDHHIWRSVFLTSNGVKGPYFQKTCVVFYFKQWFWLNQGNHSARRPQNYKYILVCLCAFVLPFPCLYCKSYNDNHM